MFTEKPTFEPGIPDALVEGERLPPGTEFGSYRVGDAIGAGAMGTVYRAEHTVLKKQVALKLMAPALRTEAESRQRFLLEAKTTAAIKHRHVIEIFDFGECQGNPYIVMELLHGQDLDRYLQTLTRLSSEQAATLLLPIAAALASAHDAGVIHRDLKPSNIFCIMIRTGRSCQSSWISASQSIRSSLRAAIFRARQISCSGHRTTCLRRQSTAAAT